MVRGRAERKAIGDDEIAIDVVDADWETGTRAVVRIGDSSPPDDVTELADLGLLARLLDRSTVPRRTGKVVAVPIPAAAFRLLKLIDGTRTLHEILEDGELSDDQGVALVQALFQSGMIVF